MDIVASVGYIGQTLFFFDNDRFAYITGRSICIYDTTKGPRDMIWRSEFGINQIATNFLLQTVAISTGLSGGDVETLTWTENNTKNYHKNPTMAAIIEVSYSRLGDKLFGLTDLTDHRLLIWNSINLIANYELKVIYKRCTVNPCESNMFVLYGEEGLAIGTVTEALSEHSVVVEPIQLVSSEAESEVNHRATNKINFVLWLPLNRVLVGSATGMIYCVNAETKSSSFLGTFKVPDKRASVLTAVSAVLSVSSVIIGTDNGSLYWFPVGNLMSAGAPDIELVELHGPQQMARLSDSAISSLAVDPSYQQLLVGSQKGEIFKVSLLLSEDPSNEEPRDVFGGAAEQAVDGQVPVVEGVLLGSDPKQGVVLCSTHLTMGVQKFSGRSKSSLTLLVTGSHLGVVAFWRQSAQVVEPMVFQGGIRRSAPRALKSLFSILVTDQGFDTAVSSLEFFGLPNKNAALCCVGLEDGRVELWGLEAFEHEEEDGRDDQHAAHTAGVDKTWLVEDDEGVCVVRVEVKKLFETRLFHAPVSLLSLVQVPGATGEGKVATLAMGCHCDSRLYFVPVVRNNQLDLAGVSSFVAVGPAESPRAMVCGEDSLSVFCHSGAVYSFEYRSIATSAGWKSCVQSGLEGLTGAVLSPSTLSQVVLLAGSNAICVAPLSALHQHSSPITESPEFGSFEQSDIAICAAYAPSGRFFATGGIDGSVHVWRVDSDDRSSVFLANRVHAHGAAVISVSFSTCSSLLVSCAVDGSLFVMTLEKPVARGHKATATRTNLFQDAEVPSVLAVFSPKTALPDNSSPGETWFEHRETELVKELRVQQKFKSMGIAAAVGEISQRLAVLILQNDERSELERLPRSAFVINVKEMDTVLECGVADVHRTRAQYLQRNRLNEALAARIRAKCWDCMAETPGCVVPFTELFDQARPSGGAITSYAVQRRSASQDELLRKLKTLRALELRAQRSSSLGSVSRAGGSSFYRTGWTTSLSGCPPSLSWIANDGTRWPTYDTLEGMLAEESGSAAPAGEDQKNKAANAQQVSGLDDDDDQSVQSLDEDRDIDEDNLLNLLYAPQSVRTQVQKRTQIFFLKEIVRQLKSKFNERWNVVYREKEDILNAVESRNARIKVILQDLHLADTDLFRPSLKDEELPRSHITVSERDMVAERFESESARTARLKEEEDRRRREAEADSEDVKGRALQEMMHGTLEVKRDVFAEASALDRPEWMDVLAVSEMSEAQLREYDDYQQRLKALQEEQAAYRKALEQEMKKLRSEIVDACRAFDERLDELAKLKVLVSREILAHESYIARIAANMAQTEQSWSLLKKTEHRLVVCRKERSDLRAKLERFSARLEDMKHRVAALEEEGKQMDKSFKRDLQNLCNNTFDQDKLKIFTQLYRQRVYPRSSAYDESATENFGEQSEVDVSASVSNKRGRSTSKGGKHSRSQKKSGLSGSNADATKARNKLKASRNVSAGGLNGKLDGNLGPMQQAAQALRSAEEADKAANEKDPYFEALLRREKHKKAQESQIPLLTSLNMELDCPEGFDVDQFYWSKLQELRSARIEKEVETKVLAIELEEFKQKMELVDCEEQAATRSINDLKAVRASYIEQLRSLESDLVLVVSLRQGQDEVDRDAVVTDYGDALLLPVEVIAKYNMRIRDLGKEKIGVLSKIKQFRRKINLIAWEAYHHALEAKHYESYLTDLQLFRVTRELQKIIREVQPDSATQTKDKQDKAAARKSFLAKEIDSRLMQLRKTNDMFVRQLDERNQECLALVETIASLRVALISSKSVKQSRDDSRGGLGDSASSAAQKMKKVVGRRRLVDTARAQAEEIDFLRQELDKMRQRTFPSFVRATKKRLTVN